MGDKRPLPLNIVLGGLSSTAALPAAAPDASASPTAYILGTSYFATPRLGAPRASSGTPRAMLRLNKDGRVLGEDRKGPLDHFKSKSLVMSTVRLTAINISTTLSGYFSDQLKAEQNTEAMVDSRKISLREADDMNEEWERREWELRMTALPKKIGWAVLRFHACITLMRLYEILMARYVLQVEFDGRGAPAPSAGDGASAVSTHSVGRTHASALTHERAVTVMDKLTRDTFRASLRTSQLLHAQEHAPGMVLSSRGTATSTSREVTRTMFATCLWANVIPFFAELTVQQLVLAYGYGTNYLAREKRKRDRRAHCTEEEDDISDSAYALSLAFRSSRLTIAKSMSWIVASAGGALGSVVYPGWGVVFGVQIGDTVVGALID